MKLTPLFGIVVLIAGCFGVTPEKTELEGETLPDFNLQLIDSTSSFSTKNIPYGKPFALFYFTPECPYCRAQITDIIDNMNKLKETRFYLISNFPIFELKKYVNELRLDRYPNILVGRDTSGEIASYLNVPAIPYIVIYNDQKKLKKAFSGKISSRQLKKIINAK